MDNMIRKYEPSATTTGANVAQGLASGCLSEHDFTFYSDLDSTAEEVLFENVNPVDAILGDYSRGGTFDPGVSTRGLYVRGVE